MFIAGKKTSELKSEITHHIICPKCHKTNTTTVSVTGVYRHLFQIPFLSGKKNGMSNCSKCSHSHTLENMPDSIKLAYYELKERVRTPIWFYSGLIAVKILVLIKIFSKYI